MNPKFFLFEGHKFSPAANMLLSPTFPLSPVLTPTPSANSPHETNTQIAFRSLPFPPIVSFLKVNVPKKQNFLSRLGINRVDRVANPTYCGQLNRENRISLSPFVPEKFGPAS